MLRKERGVRKIANETKNPEDQIDPKKTDPMSKAIKSRANKKEKLRYRRISEEEERSTRGG